MKSKVADKIAVEKTPEELKRELIFYQACFLKIEEATHELRQRIGLKEEPETIRVILEITGGTSL